MRRIIFFVAALFLSFLPLTASAQTLGAIQVQSNAPSNTIYVNSSGYVGIGTTSPTNTLQIGTNPQGFNGNDFVVSNSNGDVAISNNSGSSWIYASQRLDLYGNATNTMTLKSGNVGIGTTSPGQALQVVGQIGAAPTGTTPETAYHGGLVIENPSATGQYINLIRSGSAVWSLGTVYNSTSFAIGQGNATDSSFTSPAFVINNAGSVGIGTTSPNALLDIGSQGTTLGTLRLEGNTSGYTQIQPSAAAGSWTMTLPVSGGTSGYVLSTDGSGNTSWISNAGTASTALSGLTAATATHTINNANFAQTWTWNTLAGANALSMTSTSTVAASNAQTMLNIALSGANGTSTQTTYGEQISNTHTGTSSTNVGLYATASGGTNNYAAIFNAGNVGIGTTTPTNNLHVYTTTDLGGITIDRSTNTTVGSNLTFATAGVAKWYFGTDNNSTENIYFYAGGTMVQSSLTSGNVGIGTTAPSVPLSLGTNTIQTIEVAAYDGGPGSMYGMGTNGGELTFGAGINANGTAQMVLQSNGNVGIGTTSPANTLDVNGSLAVGTYAGTAAGASNELIVGGSVGIGTTSPGDTLEISNNGYTSATFTTYNNGGNYYPGFVGRLAEGTSASPSATASGDRLFVFGARGYTDSHYWSNVNTATMTIKAAENFTTTTMGTYIFFETTPIGSTTRAERMRIDTTGNVGIGTTSPGYTLDVNGQIHVGTLAAASATSICRNSGVLSSCSSSIRYKERVKDAWFGLKEVLKMRPVTFKWKGRDENDIGFIAEEMEKISPLFVTYERGQIEGVKYPQLTAVLANAVKEQQGEIEALKAQNRALAARLDALEQNSRYQQH